MLRQAALIVALSIGLPAAGQQSKQLALTSKRQSTSDLEVLSLGSNGTHSSSVFLSRAFLAGLPQVTFILKSDESFPELPANGAHIAGIDIDSLIHAVEPTESSVVAVAICRDGYASPFPRQALDDHHPILVLTIDGLSPRRWAAKHHTYDPGPYFVTYQNFVPSFHILAHEDRAQRPAEIVRIKILRPEQLFAAIAPPDSAQLPPDSPVIEGFGIAQQNCFRCHNSGETGGTKAHQTWQHVGQVAKARPDFFAAMVHDPQAIDPHSKMTPNMQYDQATLKALTRYFENFAP